MSRFNDSENRWRLTNDDKRSPEVALDSVMHFADFIRNCMRYGKFVYRGEKNDIKLFSSFDKVVENTSLSVADKQKKFNEHLLRFRKHLRGRRGNNPQLLNDDNMLALGQHYGLKTNLLDWTESPFVALFFAIFFATPGDAPCVYALSQRAIGWAATETKKDIKFIEPEMDENARLISQRGLLLKLPIGSDVKSLVEKTWTMGTPALLKIKIKNNQTYIRQMIKNLDEMNINSATLFPDIIGSAHYCNKLLADETDNR